MKRFELVGERRYGVARYQVALADGGVPGLKHLATANLNCAAHANSASMSSCANVPSLGENAAAQIILQSTQRATLPTPPARVIRGD